MEEEVQTCSNCKKDVAKRNLTVHVAHCTRNVAICSLCQEPVPRCRYQQHVQQVHQAMRCDHCSEEVDGAMLHQHQKELCPKRLVKCEYCDLELTSSDLPSHKDYCGSRTNLCKGCNKHVQRRFLQFHYQNDHKYTSPEEANKMTSTNGSDSQDEEEECPVCLGPVVLPLALECGHVFCMVCVKGIANTTKNCAICRRDIQRDMLMDIRFCSEEDVIKNYVNNPKYKKNCRSKSMPRRLSGSSKRLGYTTQDYDNMVSALMSNRAATSPTSYRYQRPNNSHTPPSYTPYCFASKEAQSGSSPPVENSVSETSVATSMQSTTALKRPTTLDLSSVQETSSSSKSNEAPCNSTECTPISPASSKVRAPFQRSQSMPEREDSREQSYSQDISNKNAESSPMLNTKDNIARLESQSRLPPTSPRYNNSSSSSSSSSSCTSSNVTSASITNSFRSPSLVKSSSDPNTTGVNGNTSALSTGTRPKSSTGLKKRVSFKEDAPPVRREAPAMLPCEFCEEVFAERDLMRHQTSCEHNETQQLRASLLTRRLSNIAPPSSTNVPPLPSPSTTTNSFSSSSNSSYYSRSSDSSPSPFDLHPKTSQTPPQSPSPRPHLHSSRSSSISASPQPPFDQDHLCFNSQRTSESPCQVLSVSSSSGVSSGVSSISSSSGSTTPSTSNSASPVPATATPGTPTDIEADFEEDGEPYSCPRRGRFLSSAIVSWKSISGSSRTREKPKYTRSNTAPLEDTLEMLSNSKVTTSHSASHVPPAEEKEEIPHQKPPTGERDSTLSKNKLRKAENVFVKNPKKYPAPPPPSKPPNLSMLGRSSVPIDVSLNVAQNNDTSSKPLDNVVIKKDNGSIKAIFKFDSKPIMDSSYKLHMNEFVTCHTCKENIAPEYLKTHQTMCRSGRTALAQPAAVATPEQPQGQLNVSESGQSRVMQQQPMQQQQDTSTANDTANQQHHSNNAKITVKRSQSLREGPRQRNIPRCCLARTEQRSPVESSPLHRRWASGEDLFGESSLPLEVPPAAAPTPFNTSALNRFSGGHAWTSHLSMVKDNLRTRLTKSALATTYPSASPSFYRESRYRDSRNISRPRPSSLYS